MVSIADELEQNWRSRLLEECSEQSQQAREGILSWLLGSNRSRFEALTPNQLTIAQQAMEYRYRILRQRYLGVSPTQAYRNLINRLGALAVLRNKIRTWVALSRDRQRAVTDVLEEVVQEMLNRDRAIQQQIDWITRCTQAQQLRNTLLLASLEEYCLRPIRNQPLIVYRFVNYLRRQSRGGMTQVPRQEMVQLISEEVNRETTDSSGSLLEHQAVANYRKTQEWEDKQSLRQEVQREFEGYLAERVGDVAVQWLRLYLRGRSQEAIAAALDLEVKQVYRLREKISYHALRGFVLRKPELVADWLEISLTEHNLGLTPKQWETYWQNLSPIQRQLIQGLKTGKSLEDISEETCWKNSYVIGEWSKLYHAAQTLRNS